MLPVMTSRQVRNGQLRVMGVQPTASYHTSVGPGDEVAVQEVRREPFRAERFYARVIAVIDHGCYKLVSYERIEGGKTGVARVFAAGPPDWGVIEFRVIRKVHRPLPSRQDRGDPLSSPDNPVVRLAKPGRCPVCHRLYEWRPRMGWPCLECRRQEEGKL